MTALSGRADTVDRSEEETVINGAPFSPRPFQRGAASFEAANSLEAANRRLDTRLAEQLRRRALAVMRAR
jgi:hypothetical protein